MIDVEKLARKAGFCICGETGRIYTDIDRDGTIDEKTLKRFAALVLEQAVQTTDDGSIEGHIFAQAIRAMKPEAK